MKKSIDILKMNIEAGKASPAPPVGPALGVRGLNMMAFCKEFNDLTKDYKAGTIVPTEIHSYEDKSTKVILLSPSCSYFINKLLNVPNVGLYGSKEMDPRIIYHIAKLKQKDLPSHSLLSICKSVSSSAFTLGIKLKKLSR
uniref:Large ribosomal subunit protein uL11m n=1 Tax=Jakoba libera TaxID=143017 RepID=M4QLA7_JAKLI|nr:ribosomal protein L11 [Jakoba libera]AGH24228.1 ribosomal protein L11 [Jakoba libera]